MPTESKALPAAPPPIVLNGEGNTVTLNEYTFSVYLFRDRPCVVAADLGRALGYGEKKFVDSLRQWRELLPGRDKEVLTGPDLAAFKAAREPQAAFSPHVTSLTILYETGMDIACQKAQTEAGFALRRYLAEEVLPRLRRGEVVSPAAPPLLSPTSPPSIEAKLDKLLDAVGALVGALPVLLAARAPTMPRPRPAIASLPLPFAAPPQPPPVALIPRDWQDANETAAWLSGRTGAHITARKVHDIIRTQTTIRSDPTLARQRPSIRIDGNGQRHEHPQWFYAPAVAEMIAPLLAAS
jgi:hypothetical protein